MVLVCVGVHLEAKFYDKEMQGFLSTSGDNMVGKNCMDFLGQVETYRVDM